MARRADRTPPDPPPAPSTVEVIEATPRPHPRRKSPPRLRKNAPVIVPKRGKPGRPAQKPAALDEVALADAELGEEEPTTPESETSSEVAPEGEAAGEL